MYMPKIGDTQSKTISKLKKAFGNNFMSDKE